MCLCSPNTALGGFPSWLPASRAAWGSFHHPGKDWRTPRPGARAAGTGSRRGPQGPRGEERCRAHMCRLMVHPSTLLFQVLEVFANQQLKFCTAQKSMIPKSVYGCFKERKHDTPS